MKKKTSSIEKDIDRILSGIENKPSRKATHPRRMTLREIDQHIHKILSDAGIK